MSIDGVSTMSPRNSAPLSELFPSFDGIAEIRVSEVNNLVERFDEARKMMASMGRGGMPAMPGMPGMAGPGRSKPGRQAKAPKKAKRGSGNPAKRVAEERAAAQRRSETEGSANAAAMESFELPEELKGLLPPS